MQLDDGKEDLIRLGNGPADNSRRSCTDIFCLIIFALLFLTIPIIGIYAHINGNIDKINQGYDADHHLCGIEYPNYPYIYFASPNPDNLWKTVCVSSCPAVLTTKKHHLSIHDTTTTLQCKTNSVITSCTDADLYDTILFDQRVCVPTQFELYDKIFKGIKMGYLHQLISDVAESKYAIMIFVLMALFFTICFVYLLRWCSNTIVWFMIVIIVGISIFFGYYSYQQYRLATTYTMGTTQQGYLITSVIWWSIALATIILTMCFYKRIKLAIAIIRCASDFVTNNYDILWCPFFIFILSVTMTIVLLYILLLIYSTGTISTDEKLLPFSQFHFNIFQHGLGIFLLCFSFWIYASLIAINNFIISGAVCIWYFQQGRSGQEHVRPLSISVTRLLRFHLGTALLGGFLLGIMSVFRIFLEYLYRNAEYLKNSENLKCCFKCCTCCIWCFERFLQYLNQNIYVQTNMTGEGFFKSAKNALDIMTSNLSLVMTVVGLGDLLNNIARLLITMIISMSFYRAIMDIPKSIAGVVVDPYNPTLILAIITFVIATVFTSIFGVAIESILHLYCIDEEIGRTKGKEAEMCPAALKEFLGEQIYNQEK